MTVKTCSTCAHRYGGNGQFAKCRKTGLYCSTARQFIEVAKCDVGFSGWAPRPSIFEWIKIVLCGAEE